jgi:hypothetical protein
MVERSLSMREVSGSIPDISIFLSLNFFKDKKNKLCLNFDFIFRNFSFSPNFNLTPNFKSKNYNL